MEAPEDLCGNEISVVAVEPSSVPLPDEVRFPLSVDTVSWYDCSRYRTQTTQTASTNNKLYLYGAPGQQLSAISEHTWNEFWSEIDYLANLLVTAKKLDAWFWVILLPVVALECYRDVTKPQHSDRWEFVFWAIILIVPLVFIALDMYVLQVDPDRALQETCRYYSPLFRTQAGYQVVYRKEWRDDAETFRLYRRIAFCYCTRPIVRFVQFRPAPDSENV